MNVPALPRVIGPASCVALRVVSTPFGTTHVVTVAQPGPVITICAADGSNPLPAIVSVNDPTVTLPGEMLPIDGAGAGEDGVGEDREDGAAMVTVREFERLAVSPLRT